MQKISISNCTIGEGAPAFLIAEVAQTHEGSLGMAHAYIDAVAEAGANAIKFQTHIASEESTLDEPFRVAFSKQDSSRYEYWNRMEFTKEQWKGLANHARERGLIFLSSAFCVAAVRLLQEVGMSAWKIGSGEVSDTEVLKTMAKNGAPILLSTGMSDFREIENCVSLIKKMGLQFAILQCTSEYPASLKKVGLNVIDELRTIFKCPVGLSDHSGQLFPALAALAKGANIIEVHVVFDRRMFGPDVLASLTIEELKFLVEARDAFWVMDSNPVNKNELGKQLGDLREIFGKSLAPKRELEAGTVLTEEMLTEKKPGFGIPPADLPKIVGRRLKRTVTSMRVLRWEDVDG